MKQVFTPSYQRHRVLKFLIPLMLSWIFAIALFISPAAATGVYDLPQLSAGSSTWVVDQAEVISLANERKLNNDLENLAKNTQKEVRFIGIRRLNYGETIDSLADDLFNKWYPTPEEQANQTILILDTLTNSTALRRGEAVKNLLTDNIVDSIINESIAIPLRKGGLYNRAFLITSDRLVAVLSGKPDPGPPEAREINIESTFTSAEDTDDTNATIWVVVLLVLATAIPMATYFWYVGLPGR
ncbi:MAG TPA: beta-propeller domain-containing protein, methanol dehydrogenase [Cyanothece sp. UBA12306]|nr:beta-propeller domain-containing protein, methanol dehydrogenase [Cyanothece sp. UBA12306]